MNPIETLQLAGGYALKIYQDEDAEAPEQESTLWIETGNNRYFVPRIPRHTTDKALCDSFPLYAYVHGSIALSLSPFSCPWDSGQIGMIYVAKSEAGPDCTTERIAQGKVREWSSYLGGERYGYRLESPDGDEVDSCWGCDDLEYMKGEALAAHVYHMGQDAKAEKMLTF